MRQPGRWARTIGHVNSLIDEMSVTLGVPRQITEDDIKTHVKKRLPLPLLAWQEPQALLPMSVLTLLIVWRHRGNLRDLFAGRERHF